MAARAWDNSIVFVVVYLWGNGANKCKLSGDGPHSRAETRASDYRLCDALVTMKTTSNKKERK